MLTAVHPVVTPDAEVPLRLYGDDDHARRPDADPARRSTAPGCRRGCARWTRGLSATGETAQMKRATITVTVPTAARTWPPVATKVGSGMSELVIARPDRHDGRTVRPRNPLRGRVWIRDGRIVAVTSGTTAGGRVQPGARGRRRETRSCCPGFIDMHNHLAYNALAVVVRTRPDRAVAAQQALARRRHVHRVDHRAGVGLRQGMSGSAARLRAGAGDGRRRDRVQGWPTANRGYRTVDPQRRLRGRWNRQRRSHLHVGGDQDRRRAGRRRCAAWATASGFIYHCAEGQRGVAGAARLHRPRHRRRAAADVHRDPLLRRRRRRTGRSGPRATPAGSSGRRCRTWCCTRRRR